MLAPSASPTAPPSSEPLIRDRRERRGRSLAPDLFRELDAAGELGPLLLLGQQVALLGRGEAALRRQAELLERGELRRLVDAALELVLALQRAGLGGHDAQHHRLALRSEERRV